MNLRPVAFAFIMFPFALGCSGAREDDQEVDIRQTSEALTDVEDDPVLVPASVYTITSFDAGTNTLTAVNGRRTITGTFTPRTIFRAARINRFAPVDPCRDAAVAYNNASLSFDGLSSSMTSFVTFGCEARVRLNANATTIRAFRPVPSR